MSSTLGISQGEEYSKYSAFEDDGGVSTQAHSTSFAMQSKTAEASMSLADVKFGNDHVACGKQAREYSRDEFLYALSSPSSIGAMAWIISSFVAVIYGSSIIVYLNFCIPLFVGPYVINEQMPAQLLPSVRRKFNKIKAEATELQIKSVQLKGIVSRMQRQEYRLSAAEERFEHLCRRNDKDVAKMKQLARKNATLRNKIKVDLAGRQLDDLLTRMLQVDVDVNHRISEKKVYQAVQLMGEFAGKNTFATLDKEVIHRAMLNSLAKNMKTTNISYADSDDEETRDSEADYDVREKYPTQGESLNIRKDDVTEDSELDMDLIAGPSHQSYEADTTLGDESMAVSNKGFGKATKLEPSGHDFGTADRPIDIEKLLFQSQKLEAE